KQTGTIGNVTQRQIQHKGRREEALLQRKGRRGASLLQRVDKREAAVLQCVGRRTAALDAADSYGDAERVFKQPKLVSYIN
ncbi:hypothetical protein HAX54_003155, partial [Datura stramonium]|nr:hypothetical protein [Datura stramonium]